MIRVFFTISLVMIFLSVTAIAEASELIVNVNEIIQGNIKYLYNNTNENIFKITPEIYNSGSVGYRARARTDIFYKDNMIFTGWSSEKSLVPSDQKAFDMYWYQPNASGIFKARLRLYYGWEIYEKNISFEIKTGMTEDIFEIQNFRTYDNYIRFDLRAKQSFDKILVLPSKYPLGWVFEQTKIEKLNANGLKPVVIPYEPSLWKPSNVSLIIVTEDGKYYTEKQFEMKKEEGIIKYINQFLDGIRSIFSF